MPRWGGASLSGVAAAAISFGVGFAILAALAVALGDGGAFVRAFGQRWWLWTGGALGAFYVASIILVVPVLGVVSAFAVLILGQMLLALVLDATGAFGLPVTAISWQRIAAVLLVGAGVVMSRL